MIKRLLLPLAALAVWLSFTPAQAQLVSGETVSACGTPNHTPPTGIPAPLTVDPQGRQCTANSGGSSSITNLPNPADTNTGAAGVNTLRVVQATSSAAVISFRQTSTASAAALPSNALTNGLVCQALTTNTGTIHIGGSGVTTTSADYPLVAGQAISYGVSNSNLVYIIGSNTTDVLSCTGN